MSPREFKMDDYIDVAERLREFSYKHPSGSLQSKVIAWPTPELSFVVVEARAYRTQDDLRPGVGLAWEPFPGRTPYTKDSELQNAETSAWGRALVAVLAADTKRGIASSNEIRNRQTSPESTSVGLGSKAGEARVDGEAAKASPVTTSSAGEARAGVEGDKPRSLPAEDPTPAAEPSAGHSTSVPPEVGSDGSASGSKPTCSVNGAFHFPDPELSMKAREGFVVCACGEGMPQKRLASTATWLEAVPA